MTGYNILIRARLKTDDSITHDYDEYEVGDDLASDAIGEAIVFAMQDMKKAELPSHDPIDYVWAVSFEPQT